MSSVASVVNGGVVMWREPGARTWEPSIVPASASRDVTTPWHGEVAPQKKICTTFMRIRTTSTVSEKPKSSEIDPMRNGGMSRRKNRTGGSVMV